MTEAIEAGMSRYMLYRLASLPMVDNPDFAAVSMRYPKAVLCLISALSMHDMTTEIPHRIYIALPRNSRTPATNHPPLFVHRFSGGSYSEGIEIRDMDGIKVKVYCVEKTLADCFKYRNKIGMDVVLEALKFYRERYRFDGNKIMRYARICRVENIMRPYLEATL